MQLTKQTNHALRILMYCASHDKPVRVRDIAGFYNLSEQFLHKTLQLAVGAGFVETLRGRNGGLRLARPASEIRVGDVVRAIEDRFELADCFSDEANCPLEQACNLSSALRRALQAFFDVLNEYTIADLIDNRASINVLTELEAMMNIPLKREAESA
jgi:Rrf2 family protein